MHNQNWPWLIPKILACSNISPKWVVLCREWPLRQFHWISLHWNVATSDVSNSVTGEASYSLEFAFRCLEKMTKQFSQMVMNPMVESTKKSPVFPQIQVTWFSQIFLPKTGPIWDLLSPCSKEVVLTPKNMSFFKKNTAQPKISMSLIRPHHSFPLSWFDGILNASPIKNHSKVKIHPWRLT